MVRRAGLPVAVALAVLVALVIPRGGGGGSERQDAHQTPGSQIDRSPAEVFAMPDRFNNVASKCDKRGHRIFVTSNKDRAPSNLVVIEDSSCGR
jgi:hypothetical protein